MQTKTIKRVVSAAVGSTDKRKIRRCLRAARDMIIKCDTPYPDGSWCQSTKKSVRSISQGIHYDKFISRIVRKQKNENPIPT